MRNSTLLFALLMSSSLLIARQTRTEVTNPTTPKEDSKENSDSVPAAYAIEGKILRVVVVRLKFETDLLAGLESMVKQEKIHNGIILSGIGSVRNYRYHAVSNRTFPSKDVFVADSTEPADIVGMNGYVINGRLHVHVTFANGASAFGGHLEPGTNVFTFAIVTIGVLSDDMDLKQVDDKTYR